MQLGQHGQVLTKRLQQSLGFLSLHGSLYSEKDDVLRAANQEFFRDVTDFEGSASLTLRVGVTWGDLADASGRCDVGGTSLALWVGVTWETSRCSFGLVTKSRGC